MARTTYDEWAAYYRTHPIEYIERYYIMRETGKPIQLEPWQKEKLLVPTYAAHNGRLDYQIVVWGLPKGNAKTRLGAAVAQHKLLTAPRGAELFAAANSKEQATRAWQDVAEPIEMCPELANLCKVSRKGDDILVKPTGVVYKCISSEDITAHGMRPYFVHFDEMHGQKERALYVAIQTSMGKVSNSQFLLTSTAGELESVLHGIYKTAVREAFGEAFDDASSSEVTVDGRKHPIADKRFFMYWSFVNLLTQAKDEEYLARERRNMTPAEYSRWHDNRWVSDASSFIGPEDINRCHNKELRQQTTAIPGVRYIYTLDIGLKHDNTCRMIGYRDPRTTLIYPVNIRTWIPQPNHPVQMIDIEKDLLWCHDNFHCAEYHADPHQAASLRERAARSGIAIEEFGITQNVNAEMSSFLYMAIHNGQCQWPANDPEFKAMEDELLTLIAKQTSAGVRFDHPKHGKSDRATVLAMLITVIMRNPVREPHLAWH